MYLWHRRLERPWAEERPDGGAHDAGVIVDEQAWAEIVRELKRTSRG
ncbi:hypothetical protein [Spirillospora sp. NPDC047279]